MPHRKSPSKVAENFIKRTAKFDRLKREASNTVSESQVLAELERVFPKKPNGPESPGAECFPEGWFVGLPQEIEETRQNFLYLAKYLLSQETLTNKV